MSACNQSSDAASVKKISIQQVSRGDLLVGLSADGQIVLPVTYLNFELDGVIKEIYIENGQEVKTGDLLAELDDTELQLAVSDAKTNLEKANVSYSDALSQYEYNIKNSTMSLESTEKKLMTPFDDYSYQLSIRDAQTSLERRKTELEEAIATSKEPYDAYNNEMSIADAKLSLDKRMQELAEATSNMDVPFDDYSYQNNITELTLSLEKKQKELIKAEEAAKEPFDSYSYQTQINEAKINLDRKLDALESAEEALTEAQQAEIEDFDDYSYQLAITSAQTTYNRKKNDYDEAVTANRIATDNYWNLIEAGADSATLANAESKANDSITKLNSAKSSLEDAATNLNKANEDYKRALNNYNESADENREKSITEAQKAVDTAATSVSDATRSYDKAVSDLERAQASYTSDMEDKVESAQSSVDDAQRSLSKAMTDLERAKVSYESELETKLKNAQSSLDDAKRSYSKALTDLERAKSSYAQEVAAAVEKAKTSVADAELSLENAKNNMTRAKADYIEQLEEMKQTYELQSLSLDNQQSSSLSVTNALLAIEDAKLMLTEAENNLEKIKIYAPMDGQILNISKSKGEIVSAQNNVAMPIFGTGDSSSSFITIRDTSEIYLSASITESDIVGIEVNQAIRVTVDALEEENLSGTVYTVSSLPTTDSSGITTYEVTCKFDDVQDAVKDGMNAFIVFIKKEQNDVLLIPNKAVFIEENKQYVYVQTQEGEYEKRAVVCGLSNGTQTELVSGLEEGESVVVGSLNI